VAFIEAFEFGLDAAFVHTGGKLDDHVLGIDKDVVTAKIHSSTIEARHLRVELGRLQSFFGRHAGCSTCGGLNDHLRASRLDGIDDHPEAFAVLGGGAVVKASVQMDNGSACFMGEFRLADVLFDGIGDSGVHLLGDFSAADCRGDDNLVCTHVSLLGWFSARV